MGLIKKSKKQQAESNRIKRLSSDENHLFKGILAKESLVNFTIYFTFTIAVIIVCFVGLSPAGPSIQLNQISRIRVVAEVSFEYTSQIQTRERQESQRLRVPPVYRLESNPQREFEQYLLEFYQALIEYADPPADAPPDLRNLEADEVQHFQWVHDLGNPYNIRPSDLAALYNRLGPQRSEESLREGLILLREISNQGIFDQEDSMIDISSGGVSFFQVQDEMGNIRQVEILSKEDALRSLRIQLQSLDIPRDSTIALLRILRLGIQPNLAYDAVKTQELIERAKASIRPIMVQVQAGDTILEPNSRVTPQIHEQLEAYRRALRAADERELVGISPLLMERGILTIAIIIGAAFYLRTIRIRIQAKHRIFVVSGLLVLLNLAIARFALELGNHRLVETFPQLSQLIPWLIPVTLGPIILTLLVGTGPAVIAAGLINVFNGMMQGNSLSVLIAGLLSSLVAIYLCRNIQLRAKVVRASLYAGAVFAVAALLMGIRDSLDFPTIAAQLLTAISVGLFTGVIVVGLLPIWEYLFKYTTDITLLELTDFNHPLLRKMQVEAPGSYHHSLMVANLSENAAAAIGANPLVCRVCALFHDIGKMIKPEYYAENQRSGYNPHIERNPSMSALVIKSHVKEGVQLARQFKLPQIIVDVIRQHHGTSLINYFYYKALEKQKMEFTTGTIAPNAPRIELDKVDEDTYRYEGPVPQFVESAIIMLADSIEAASRSLRKVTPQSIEELIDSIVSARLEDEQLDDTPLTFKQLTGVKESFTFTLLNMLHARVEYPDEARESEKKARKKQTRQSRFTHPDSSISNPPMRSNMMGPKPSDTSPDSDEPRS